MVRMVERALVFPCADSAALPITGGFSEDS